MSRKNCVILGLGSNLGKKSSIICQALSYIDTFCDIESVSPIYKTESLLKDDQDAYFNLCALIHTDMQPNELIRT